MSAHFERCGAPICQQDGGDMWYPEEEICTLRPFETFQKSQRKIQKLYEAGKVSGDYYFTFEDLDSMERVRPGRRGRKPEDGKFASTPFEPKIHA